MFKLQKPLPLLASAAAAVWLCGCVEADKAGPPQLMSFAAVGPDGTPVAPTAALPVPVVSPLSSFTAVFDNVIDYTDVQDADAGVGKPGVVVVTAPIPVSVDTNYNPGGHHKWHLIFPPGPAITAQLSPGLPSGAAGSVTLDVSKIRGKGGQPLTFAAGTVAQWNFVTEPFGVVAAAPQMTYPPAEPIVIAANNVPTMDFPSTVTVSGTLNDMPIADLAAEVTPEEGSAVNFVVTPSAGAWPEGAIITVTVTGAKAELGGELAAPVVINFPMAVAAAAP